MGQKNSSMNPSQGFLSQELIFLRQMSHPAYGDIKIYQNLTTNDFLALRTLLKDSKSFDQSFPLKLQQYQSNVSNEYLIKLIKYENFELNEFCSNFNRLTMLYEYFPKSLASEFLTRRLQSELFQEVELLHMLIALLSALSALKLQSFNYSDLAPENILLSRTGLVKLTPIDDLTGLSRYKKMFFGSKDMLYVSPEQLTALSEKLESREFDDEKENVFSLGMILLEGVTLNDIRGLYDFEEFRVKYEIIENILIDANLSDSFKFLLRKMLDPDPDNRPVYEELLGELVEFKDNFLGIKLHCYSVKDVSELNLFYDKDPLNANQNNDNQLGFNEENLEVPSIPNEIYGFSSYVGFETSGENKKNTTQLLNLQEIGGTNDGSGTDIQNQKECVDIGWFRSHIELLVTEGVALSEEIQRKYQVLTNKKAIFPDDYDGTTFQSSLFLNHRKETTPRNSLTLKKVDSSTSIGKSKDYHYFSKINAFTMSPYHRNSIELNDNNKSSVHNLIKNFDYNLNVNSSPKERTERKKMKGRNTSPRKIISNNKNDKKYFTPKRDPTEKMKLRDSGSSKKQSLFRERPVTPVYETVYWEALKKKF